MAALAVNALHRRFRDGIPAILCAAVLVQPAPVQAATPGADPSAPTLCVVRTLAIEGLDAGVLDAALDLEVRKAGLAGLLVEAGSRERCLPASGDRLVLLLGDGPSAVVAGPGDAIWPLDLGGLEASDRAQDVARRVVALFHRKGGERDAPLVAEGLPRWPAPLPVVRVASPVRRSRVQGYATVAGAYRYEAAAGLHAGVTALEGGASFYQERLQAGLALAWQPGRQADRGVFGVRMDAVEVGGRVRGGLALGPALLRAGLGMGVQWRNLRVRVPSRTDELHATTWVPVVSGDVEAAFRLGPIVRIALATTVTGHLAWTDYGYRGRSVYPGPRVVLDVALRLGFVVPGRPR